MESTKPNFAEDFEHESRRIEYKVNPDQPGLPSGEGDDHKSISFFDETLSIRSRKEDVAHKSNT